MVGGKGEGVTRPGFVTRSQTRQAETVREPSLSKVQSSGPGKLLRHRLKSHWAVVGMCCADRSQPSGFVVVVSNSYESFSISLEKSRYAVPGTPFCRSQKPVELVDGWKDDRNFLPRDAGMHLLVAAGLLRSWMTRSPEPLVDGSFPGWTGKGWPEGRCPGQRYQAPTSRRVRSRCGRRCWGCR